MVYIGEMSNLAFNSKIDKSVNLCIVMGGLFREEHTTFEMAVIMAVLVIFVIF